MDMERSNHKHDDRCIDGDRRRFIELCGKFAVAAPPAVMLLTASKDAMASHDNGNGKSQDGHSCGSNSNKAKGSEAKAYKAKGHKAKVYKAKSKK